jgi:ABC-type sugar transport system ATPase subunit
VFLFDEPLSNLDAALRVQTRIEIARLHNDLSATMIYVTHDQVEAMTLADRIVVLDQGIVQQFGSPIDLYQHPHNRFVAGFIGSPKMNFIACTPEGEGRLRLATDTLLPVAGGGNGAKPAEVGVRPEHLDAEGRGDAVIEGRVVAVERLGAESWLYIDTAAAEPLVVKAGANHQAKPGETARIGVPAAACYLFAADGRSLERRPFH